MQSPVLFSSSMPSLLMLKPGVNWPTCISHKGWLPKPFLASKRLYSLLLTLGMYACRHLFFFFFSFLFQIKWSLTLKCKIHSRLGELLYICASDGDASRLLGRSVQHFSRSIELCDDYLRGFYGLTLVSRQIMVLAHSILTRVSPVGLNSDA